jgi:hypothetical protein
MIQPVESVYHVLLERILMVVQQTAAGALLVTLRQVDHLHVMHVLLVGSVH